MGPHREVQHPQLGARVKKEMMQVHSGRDSIHRRYGVQGGAESLLVIVIHRHHGRLEVVDRDLLAGTMDIEFKGLAVPGEDKMRMVGLGAERESQGLSTQIKTWEQDEREGGNR